MFTEITKEFERISNKGWIKGINNNTNSVGLTFEKELGKTTDSLIFPDYHGIEIKCTTRFSKFPIGLFSHGLDGPYLFEMNYLLEKYGKKDFKYKSKNVLNVELKYNQYVEYNNYFYKLIINQNKIIIKIYDKNKNYIDEAYVMLESIKNHLDIKLSYMLLVKASKKIENNNYYFRYYQALCYKLKSFNTFIKMIKENLLTIKLVGRLARSGTQEGKQKNKNLAFYLSKDNINELFSLVKTIDIDKIQFRKNYFM